MPTKFDLPDPELDQFARQREYAKMLRNKAFADTPSGEMVSGIYVPKNDNWGKFINAAVGGWNDARAQGGESALVGEREKQFSEFLRKRPDMMADKVVPGTPAVTEEFPGADAFGGEGSAPVTATVQPATPDTVTRVMKPWQQQQREQADWAVSGAGIRHPLAQAMAMKGLTSGFDLAEAQVKSMVDSGQIFNVQVADDGTATGVTKTGQTVSLGKIGKEKEPKAPTIKQTSLPNNMIQDKEFVDGKWVDIGVPYNRHSKTVIGVGTGGGENDLGKTQLKGYSTNGLPVIFSPKKSMTYELQADGTTVPYTGTARTMEQFGKKEDTQAKLVGDAQAAKTLVEKASASPESFGITPAIASKLPNVIGAEITAQSLTPEQMQTRNDVMRQAAIIIHSIYGAALTRGEGGRANSWAVAPDDNFETTMSKLKSAQAYAEDAAKRGGKIADTAPAAPAAAKALPLSAQIPGGKTEVRRVPLKNGNIGIEWSDGSRTEVPK